MRRNVTTVEKKIEGVLGDCAPKVRWVRRYTWKMSFYPDRDLEIEARMIDGWLLFHTPLQNGASAHGLWQHLRANALIAGRCKIVFEPIERAMHLREDMLVIDGLDMSDDCREAVFNLTVARKALPNYLDGGSSSDAERADAESSIAPSVTPESVLLEEACAEAGWPFSKRPDGRLIVDLDVPDMHHQAILESVSDSSHRVSVHLAHYSALTEELRESTAFFMLTMNGRIRLTRAGIEETKNGAQAYHEVRLTGQPSPVVINEALSALSVACSYCSRELRALRNENLSRLYLDLRGSHPARTYLQGKGDAPMDLRREKEVHTCSSRKAPGLRSK